MISLRPFVFTVAVVIFAGYGGGDRPGIAKICAAPALVPAEDPIPGVPPEVTSADFWISRVPAPDSLLMTPGQIDRFNRENPLRGVTIFDVLSLPRQIRGDTIRDYLAANARYLLAARFSVTGDIPLETAERRRITALVDTAAVPDVIIPRFGIVLGRVSGKLWPTDIPFMNAAGDNEFDQGMVATLDFGDPVALLHTSADDLWCFVQSENFSCWIPSASVAFGDTATVRKLVDQTSPLVATGDRVPVYGEPGGGPAIGYLPMGASLPIRSHGDGFCEVLIPGRGAKSELVARPGYVRTGPDVSVGFLPYTLRNVYRQCFVPYGRRYGWGGMYDSRDCSGYVLDVFRCFGIRLPRHSAHQAQASRWVTVPSGMDRAARMDAVRSAPGGITLLQMPGHIMIYLGEAAGTPYAIHSFWAWRGADGGTDVAHRAARVAVTGLLLGEGSSRGAFVDRLTNITVIGFR